MYSMSGGRISTSLLVINILMYRKCDENIHSFDVNMSPSHFEKKLDLKKPKYVLGEQDSHKTWRETAEL